MLLYSGALTLAAVCTSPWWLLEAARGRLGKRFAERLGSVPRSLRRYVDTRRVVWLHAVSVGEVLAAVRLVAELEHRLGEGWCVVVSTTTAAGGRLAHERFGEERTFRFPLDWAFAVRPYLRALRPQILVLTESELWPRLLFECGRRNLPVAVVNARVSDRSFARAMRVRAAWAPVIRSVRQFCVQSETDAERLHAMGAAADHVRVTGNLKYDVAVPTRNDVAERLAAAAGGRPILVAGSTVGVDSGGENAMFVDLQTRMTSHGAGLLTVLAPRQPRDFKDVYALARHLSPALASTLSSGSTFSSSSANRVADFVVLDTIGDLAAVYRIATIAFVGGSLVPRGGHNPLEPAMHGVPILMGPGYENFRGIVDALLHADAIRIVRNQDELRDAVAAMLANPEAARAMGERGRQVFEAHAGAAKRTVAALCGLISTPATSLEENAPLNASAPPEASAPPKASA